MRYRSQIETFKKILGVDEIPPDTRILDLGCGNGLEAAYLSVLCNAEVYGIDINEKFDKWALTKSHLVNYDGENIPYPESSFDIIYSYHVLEHVKDLPVLLEEAARVLKPNGVAYFGTPNKNRLFSYFGMKDKSFKRKLLMNLKDWKFRLLNKFENRHGAHAGFYQHELNQVLSDYFKDVQPVTYYYYSFKWPQKKQILNFMKKYQLFDFFTPSVYMLCTK